MAEQCEKFQELFPHQEGQPTWKKTRLCWYIHANSGSKCNRDELQHCSALGNLLCFITKAI